MKRTATSAPAIGLYISAVVWTLLYLSGLLPVFEATAVVLITLGVALLVRTLPRGYAMAWPRELRERRSGARDEVSQLAWLMFGRNQTVTLGGMKHVRHTALMVLESIDIDVNYEPHKVFLRAHLGNRITASLDSQSVFLTLKELNHLIDFLEKADDLVRGSALPAPPPIDTTLEHL